MTKDQSISKSATHPVGELPRAFDAAAAGVLGALSQLRVPPALGANRNRLRGLDRAWGKVSGLIS